MRAGAKAKSAVPDLIKLLGVKDVRSDQIADILVSIGPDAKAAVQKAVPAAALTRIDAGAKSAVPMLLDLMKTTKDDYERTEFAIAAVNIDPESSKAAREWMRTQLATNGEAAYDIVDRLSDLGAKAKPFIPELLVMLLSKTPFFQMEAADTLGNIGSDAKEALPLLKELAEKAPQANVRKHAAEAIKLIEAK